MYCPNCGSNNQAEVKFCTRCGTNLGVVSEAPTGKIAEKPAAGDRMAKLTRDYYRGRRDTTKTRLSDAEARCTVQAAARTIKTR